MIWDVLHMSIHRKLNFIIEKLEAMDRKLDNLKQGELLMAQQGQDILAIAKKIDETTNAEAAELDTIQAALDSMRGQVSGGVSADEAQTITDTLSSISDRLAAASDRMKAMGSDPNNPVPAPIPAPQPVPGA